MSIRERIWTTKDGRSHCAWIVAYSDQNRTRRIKTFELKRDARDFEATVRGDVKRGIHVPESVSTTIEDAAAKWLAACTEAGLERSTLAQYSQHVNLHILPRIGREKLTAVSVPFVRSFLDRLAKDGKSPAMIRNVRVSLGSILSDAQERGDIAFNAVREMGRTKNKGRARAAQRHVAPPQVGVDLPSRDEVKAIIAASSGKVRAFIMTAAFTGLRASELRGLRWRDLDIDGRSLSVNQRADAYQAIGSPKSRKGRRAIPLPAFLVDALNGWRSDCPLGAMDLVFPNGAGNLEYHSNMVNRWIAKPQLAAAIVDPTDASKPKYSGLHCLRHFYASWCINPVSAGGLGLPAKVVQERLGHSSITVTLDVYGHLFPKGDDGSEMEAAAAFFLS
jgi:integrase